MDLLIVNYNLKSYIVRHINTKYRMMFTVVNFITCALFLYHNTVILMELTFFMQFFERMINPAFLMSFHVSVVTSSKYTTNLRQCIKPETTTAPSTLGATIKQRSGRGLRNFFPTIIQNFVGKVCYHYKVLI